MCIRDSLVEFLAAHPAVRRLSFPGLASHPSHAVARRVLELPGGMLSFAVEGGDAEGLALVRRLELFTEASSLGGVESLVSMPSNMSHVGLGEERRRELGIYPGLVRLSVGIEDPADLERDLARALEGIASTPAP